MSSDEKKKIDAVMVIEVLGRPPGYLIETLENLIKKMSEEKGVVIKEEKIMEPVAMKEKPDFYSSFAEVEVEVEEIVHLAILMFKYMPAHIEILSPQNLSLSNAGFNDLFNELTRRLHGYEELTRIIQTEKMILENQLKTLLGDKQEEAKEKKGEVEAMAEEAKIKKPRKPRAKKIKEEKPKEEIYDNSEKSVDDIEKEIEKQIEEGELEENVY